MKILNVLVALTALSIGCSSLIVGRRHDEKTYTDTYTAANEAELKEAVRRVNEFKQQLLEAGFHEISSESASSVGGGTRIKKILKGTYGNLHNVEITLWTSDKIDSSMDNKHIGAGAHSEITSNADEQEFEALVRKLQFVTTGHSPTPKI